MVAGLLCAGELGWQGAAGAGRGWQGVAGASWPTLGPTWVFCCGCESPLRAEQTPVLGHSGASTGGICATNCGEPGCWGACGGDRERQRAVGAGALASVGLLTRGPEFSAVAAGGGRLGAGETDRCQSRAGCTSSAREDPGCFWGGEWEPARWAGGQQYLTSLSPSFLGSSPSLPATGCWALAWAGRGQLPRSSRLGETGP